MTWFETLIALFRTPLALIHILKTNKKIQQNQNNIEKIRNQKTIQTKTSKPSIYVIKSYFWATKLLPNIQCLPRSLALYSRLVQNGYEVKHVIGGQKINNKMHIHAWVEYNGKALNEANNINSKFSELTSYDPTNSI